MSVRRTIHTAYAELKGVTYKYSLVVASEESEGRTHRTSRTSSLFGALPLSYRHRHEWLTGCLTGFEPATSTLTRVCKLTPLGAAGASLFRGSRCGRAAWAVRVAGAGFTPASQVEAERGEGVEPSARGG